MSAAARLLNGRFLKAMEDAPADTGLGRLRKIWWPHFIAALGDGKSLDSLNSLDLFMNSGREQLQAMALEYAMANAPDDDSAKQRQLRTQFLKSNTGKMFERFAGLAIAKTLHVRDADYCLLPFKTEFLNCCPGLTREALTVTIALGTLRLATPVDADLFAFNPTNADADLFLISVKSTLKDRFHNVPFWNLLRRCAISPDFPDLVASNEKLLRHLKYVAICTDLADEQPDFRSAKGPRNLLQIDAALLDGAFITASKAQGIRLDGDHIGPNRLDAFHWLSRFVDGLITPAKLAEVIAGDESPIGGVNEVVIEAQISEVASDSGPE